MDNWRALSVSEPATRRSGLPAFAGGAVIGTLGGLIGLGGAEFRLPLLIGVFRFPALEAVIVNKTMSLVVVASALPFRARTVPFSAIGMHWFVIVNLLAGSLLGAWIGASWATRLKPQTLYRIFATLLAAIAGGLPPEKWSSLMYGFGADGGHWNGEEKTHGGGDRREAAAG
jgi:uncharacterized membrane protein YfcA